MSKFRVDYTVNQGEMKGKPLTVIIEGTDVDDVEKRFHRTSAILANGDVSYKAEIKMVSSVTDSQLKRYTTEGIPGA